MSETPYMITNYCIIRHGRLKDGFHTYAPTEPLPVGDFLRKLYQHYRISYPKFHKMDSLSKLGFLAAEILLGDKSGNTAYEKDETGIVLANAASSLDTDINYQASIADPVNYFPSPSTFVYTLPNVVMGELCIRHQLYGENNFFVQQHFDTAFLYRYVRQLLDDGIVKRCLAGWLELEGEHHDAVLYLIEKSGGHNEGIANFTAENMDHIYSLEK